jgi:hypothetical protein
MFIKILNKYNGHYYILVIYMLLYVGSMFLTYNYLLPNGADIFLSGLVHF